MQILRFHAATFREKRQLIVYALALALLLFFLKWIGYRWILVSYSLEIYGGLIALFFTALGIWVATKLMRPKKEIIIVEKEVPVNGPFERDEKQINLLGISRRELDVLELMAEGLSNQEIADRLFVSLNTVKTHGSNLLLKLDSKRRTQAVQKAKELRIIS